VNDAPALASTRTALVLGASGAVGTLLLPQLLSDERYQSVRVLVRRALAFQHPKLEMQVCEDFTKADSAFLAVDDVYCALGTTLKQAGSKAAFERIDYHLAADVLRMARKAGAKRLMLVSSVGASLKASSFYLRVKGRLEQTVSELDFEAVHLLRPSLLLGRKGQDFRPAESLVAWAAPWFKPLWKGALTIYQPIEVATLTDALVKTAFRPESGVHVHHLPL
jgi:uncharacterized protein YbjT (DUF2867 family)